MDKVVIYCKSYAPDMYRARRLAESIKRFNTDNIPLVFSVPEQDLPGFKGAFEGIPCKFITDEEILARTCKKYGGIPSDFGDHLQMMLIKLEFWRMNLCRYYVWVDSDSYFIRPFGLSDFFYDEDTPYIVQHKLKEIREFAEKYDKKVITNFEKHSRITQQAFGRSGECYDFGSPPVIWSCRVLESFNEDFLKSRNQTIFDIVQKIRSEIFLYGEYFLYSKVEKAVQREQFFKVFHYAEQFFESQMKGESELSLSRDYAGIIMQSNWTNLNKKKKTIRDRLKKLFRG